MLTHSPALASYQITCPCLVPQTTYWLLGEMQNLTLFEPSLKSSCSKTLSYFCFRRSQILIVSSFEVDTMYFSSGVIRTHETGSECASGILKIESFVLAFHTFMLQSLWPEAMYVSDRETCMSKHLEKVFIVRSIWALPRSQVLIVESNELVTTYF